MDILQEKEKLLYEHKLTLRRIIIEKGFFLVVVVIMGLIANVLVEQYRQQQVQQRFLLEKKYEAIFTLRDDYGKMVKLFSRFSLPVKEGPLLLPTDYKDQYISAIETVMHAQNHYGAIFSDRFMEQLIYHTWVHLGIYFSDVSKATQYRLFVYAIFDEFDNLCKQELGIVSTSTGRKFDFSKWTTEDFDSGGAPTFLRQEFERWQHQTVKKP